MQTSRLPFSVPMSHTLYMSGSVSNFYYEILIYWFSFYSTSIYCTSMCIAIILCTAYKKKFHFQGVHVVINASRQLGKVLRVTYQECWTHSGKDLIPNTVHKKTMALTSFDGRHSCWDSPKNSYPVKIFSDVTVLTR